MKLNDRQLAYVLACLRCVQSQCEKNADFAAWFTNMPHFGNTSDTKPLTTKEVDRLCVRLNKG